MNKKSAQNIKVNPTANDTSFETKTFSVKMIKPSALKTLLDLTYNEAALRHHMLQIETIMENYHLMRINILREAAKNETPGKPNNNDDPSKLPISETAKTTLVDNGLI